MSEALPLDKHHVRFTQWAQSQGGVINGVAPAKFTGRGLGMVAQRALAAGEQVLFIPRSALLTIQTDKVRQVRFPKGCTAHGQLAAYLTLCHGQKAEHRIWQATWPSMKDFEEMPILWPVGCQDALPSPAKAVLSKQHAKLDKDWAMLAGLLPAKVSRALFTYYWLIVNTRCFYWDYPAAPGHASTIQAKKPPKPLPPDECMALCPFADYFNHADTGCAVASDGTGFTFTCDRDYRPGEEVYVSYGRHSNDFLLVEYGFILEVNKWDEAQLDDIILPRLSSAQKNLLSGADFLESYILDAERVCYRTEVALRALTMSPARFRRSLNGSEGASEKRTDEECLQLLQDYLKRAGRPTQSLKHLKSSRGYSLLVRRWEQIHLLMESHMKRLTRPA